MSKCIFLPEIRIDGGTQPRAEIDQATVDEYAEAWSNHTQFPPLVVYHDGTTTWLADGFHRYHAAVKAEAQSVHVDWRLGTLEQAKLHAAYANAAHGLRRKDPDKRRAIEMVLSTEEGRRWRQVKIAEHCGVTEAYVSRVVRELNGKDRPKDRQSAPTATEAKRTAIAVAIEEDPGAGDTALARRLGVHRHTVAAVRKASRSATRRPKDEAAFDELAGRVLALPVDMRLRLVRLLERSLRPKEQATA